MCRVLSTCNRNLLPNVFCYPLKNVLVIQIYAISEATCEHLFEIKETLIFFLKLNENIDISNHICTGYDTTHMKVFRIIFLFGKFQLGLNLFRQVCLHFIFGPRSDKRDLSAIKVKSGIFTEKEISS